MRVNKGGKRAPYNTKPVELRGFAGKEPRMVKSFWTTYNMDQVIAMTPEELDIAIDKYLEDFAYRQIKNDKRWNWPTLRVHSR